MSVSFREIIKNISKLSTTIIKFTRNCHQEKWTHMEKIHFFIGFQCFFLFQIVRVLFQYWEEWCGLINIQ